MIHKDKTFTFLILIYWISLCALFSRYAYTASFFLSVFICIVFVFLSLEQQWLFTLSALPFMTVFKFVSWLPSTSIILYVIFIIKSEIHGFHFKKDELIKFFLLFCVQFLLLLFYKQSFVSLVSLFVNLFFMIQAGKIIRFKFESRNEYFVYTVYIYTISTVLMSILAQVFPNISSLVSNVEQSFTLNGTLTRRFSGIAGDPNYYTQLITIAIAMMLTCMFYEINKGTKIIFSFCLFYLIYCGILTYSKSFYVIFACLLVIILFYVYLKFIKNIIGLVCILLCTPVIIYFFYKLVMSFIIPGILQRVTQSVDLTSGRISIWFSYLEMFLNNPIIFLIGAGVGNAKNMVIPFLGKAQAAHNAYIEMISDIGILGCILLYSIYKDEIKKIFACLKSPMMSYFYVFMISAMALSFSAYDTVFFMIPILQFVNRPLKK